jgi:hypothetical protein
VAKDQIEIIVARMKSVRNVFNDNQAAENETGTPLIARHSRVAQAEPLTPPASLFVPRACVKW